MGGVAAGGLGDTALGRAIPSRCQSEPDPHPNPDPANPEWAAAPTRQSARIPSGDGLAPPFYDMFPVRAEGYRGPSLSDRISRAGGGGGGGKKKNNSVANLPGLT